MFERNRLINRLHTHGQELWRRRRRISCAIVSVAAALWLVLRFTTALNWIIAAVVTGQSGVAAEVTDAHWNGWGNLKVGSVVLHDSRWPGKSADLISVRGIDVTIQPARLLLGQISISDLQVAAAEINIAERENAHGIFNLMALQPRPSSGRSPFRLQQASLGRLDIASLHVDANSRVMLQGQHAFTGSVKPKANSATEFEFELTELAPANQAPNSRSNNLVLKGNWNDDSFAYQMEVTGLSFVESLLPMLPYQFDQLWKKIDLKGAIDLIQISGQPNHPIDEAILRMRNVEANILFPGYKREWVRYEPAQITSASPGAVPAAPSPALSTGLPRMKVDQGTVRFSRNQLSFEDFKGTLASTKDHSLPLPLELNLTIALPTDNQPTTMDAAEAWLDDAIARCGIEAALRVPNFAMTEEALQQVDGVELPSPAVQVLTNLQARTWDIDLNVTATRGIAPRNSAGEVVPRQLSTKGTLNLRNGSGGYFLFPYMMTDVSARIELCNDVVTIASLEGRGSAHSLIHIDGTVTEPGDDAGVDLRIKADDVPIDDALKKSFLYGPEKVFSLLYDQQAHDRLVAAGLLKPGEYEFGGRCSVDMRVQRAVKGGPIVQTTGTILVHDANVVCSRFPYPLRVASGEIQVEDEVVTLPDGKWRVTTQSGAAVSIEGTIRIPRKNDERQVFPDLRVSFANDQVNPLLLAAIPAEAPDGRTNAVAGWPGKNLSTPARVLKQIGLQGKLSGHGHIGADAVDEHTTWDFDLFLANGSITPQPNDPEEPAGVNQILPNGFNLTKVQAEAQVTDQHASLVSLQGRIGDGEVMAQGFSAVHTQNRWFYARAQDVPIDRWLFGFLPADKIDDAMLTWGSCRPTGTISADVHLMMKDGGALRRRVLVDPTNVQFLLDGNAASVQIPCGFFELIDDALHVHDMQLDFLDNRSPLTLIDDAIQIPGMSLDVSSMSLPMGYLKADGLADYGAGPHPDGGHIKLEAHLDYIDPVFFRTLPAYVRDRLERVQLRSDGPFDLTNGVFRGPGEQFASAFSADMTLQGAELVCGEKFTDIHSQLALQSDDKGPISGMALDVRHGSLVIRNRPITDIQGSINVRGDTDDLRIPSLEGKFYGGRIWLDALVKGQDARPWIVNLGITGSDLPEVLAGRAPTRPVHTSDGRLNANVTLGGELNGDRPREGRGKIRGYDAKLGDVPLAIGLLQVTQLMPPLSQSLDEAKIDFYLRDHKVRFEKFDLTCPTLQLLGSGSLDLDAWTVSMRFKNRGTIPVASEVLGAAADLLLAIDVEGSISDPKITARALPGLGSDPSLEPHDPAPSSSTKTASP